MKPTAFEIAIIAATLNIDGTSSQRVGLAMEIWRCAEKALKPELPGFSNPHPLEDFLEKLMPSISKHDDRLPLYRQFVTEMSLEHGYQERNNFEEGLPARFTRKMAEDAAALEIGIQREMGVAHADQVAGNFQRWKEKRIREMRKKKGILGAKAKNSPENIRKRREKKAAEAAALANRDRRGVVPIVDFRRNKPSHADLSWGPHDKCGVSTREGLKLNAVSTGALGVHLPQPIDLSRATHLVLFIRREDDGDSDVHIRLVCLDGERHFKIKSSAISNTTGEILLPMEKGRGEGNVSALKEVRIGGDYKERHRFSYTLKSLEAETIDPMISGNSRERKTGNKVSPKPVFQKRAQNEAAMPSLPNKPRKRSTVAATKLDGGSTRREKSRKR